MARGDQNGARTHPESKPRGDNHWVRRNPEMALRGARNGMAKVTEDQVREMRRLHAEGQSLLSLSKVFGVHKKNIGMIVRRITWKHVA
jgi:hypothetical protein